MTYGSRSTAKTGFQYKLVKIAGHYSDAHIFGLAGEECAELIQALNKISRMKNGEYEGMEEELKDHLFEEIADVEIMMQVLKNRYRCEEQVYGWKCRKVQRWADRLNDV